MKFPSWIIISIWVGSIACHNKTKIEKSPALFTKIESSKSGIQFRNDIKDSDKFNIFTYRNFYNGGGVAIGDINNDGLSDVFFTANMGPNKLYLNKGNFVFEDISEKAGISATKNWSTGVVMADINSDGWLDIYVCNAGFQKGMTTRNMLFINNKDNTFTDSAASYGLDDDGYTTHAAFFDYDLDGDLDCYILNNSFIPVNTLNYANSRDLRAKDWPVADFLKGGGDKLLRNDNGKYIDVSEAAGIYGSLIGFGLGVTVGDVNGDHYPDIYVSNDFFERDYLYINQKNGKYHEELESWMQHISMSSMGADIADINNDGYPDMFTTDMLPDNDYRLKTTTSFENIDVFKLKQKQGFYNQYMQNTLQVNNQQGKFLETGFYSGVAASDWSWGGLIFDADNDGHGDLFVCNGVYHDVTDQDFIDFFANDVIQNMVLTGKKEQVYEIVSKMPSNAIANKAFRNKGNLTFEDASASWGLNEPSFSNGAAYGDLDNDGDLDLVVSNVGAEAFLYRNESVEQRKGYSISLQLVGNAPNTFAIGTTVHLFQQGEIITRELMPGRGFQSSVDYKIVAGLTQPVIDSIWIIWPDHSVNSLYQQKADTLLKLYQTNAKKTPLPTIAPPPSASPLLQVQSSDNFVPHSEDDYIDFYYERNIPLLLSREGPKAASGDINGDGLPDLFVGGAAGQPGQLYLQTKSGFKPLHSEALIQHKFFEDVAAIFFDADNDGDNDLLVASGGNHAPAGSPELQHRLYRNDGKGNLTWDYSSLPATNGNGSCLAPSDFDGDGDMDLFIGTRSLPQQYGVPATSYLLRNNGKGIFEDVTASLIPGLDKIGMVTATCWADVNNDNKPELLVTGEWMHTHIYAMRAGKFEELDHGLKPFSGWWKTMQATDLDGDGDTDLVLGNNGSNFYLQPSVSQPVKIWIHDFDGNGITDKIMTRSIAGKDMPVFLKRDLTDQVPGLKKQNLRFAEFATKSVQELFDPSLIAAATVKSFNYSASCIAINNGKGNFTLQPLPMQTQWSSVHAIAITDLNADGKPDLLLGGNEFGLLPQFGRLDASFGHVLLNRGKAIFEWIPPSVSGLQIDGMIRDIVPLGGRQKGWLFLRNNESPVHIALSGKDVSGKN